MATVTTPLTPASVDAPKLDYTPQGVPPPEPTPAEDKVRKHYLNHDTSLLGWLLTDE